MKSRTHTYLVRAVETAVETHQNGKNDRKYRRLVCLWYAQAYSSTYLTTGNSIGFRTFRYGQWRTHQNGGVDAWWWRWCRSMRFRLQGKRMPLKLISVDRALVHQRLLVNRSSTMPDVCERYRYRAIVVPYYNG